MVPHCKYRIKYPKPYSNYQRPYIYALPGDALLQALNPNPITPRVLSSILSLFKAGLEDAPVGGFRFSGLWFRFLFAEGLGCRVDLRLRVFQGFRCSV